METTPSDRVQLLQLGELQHPGSCALCGSGNCDRGYVDTGIWYDYEGHVYFCMYCAEQIAEVIGALLPDQSKHLEETSSEIAKKYKEMEQELERANAFVDSWNRVLHGAGVSPHTLIIPEQSPDESTEQGISNADRLISVPSEGKPVAKKSTSSKRPTDPSQSKSGNITL